MRRPNHQEGYAARPNQIGFIRKTETPSRETKIKDKRERERERDREEKIEKHQAHLVEATRESPRGSKTVMKRTASLRFAALAPQ